jgi:hypothetical protein
VYEPAGDEPAREVSYGVPGTRPIALGRKNWLHLGSDRGGRTAATLSSLVLSCKNLGNETFAYLRDVLDRVSTHPNSRIDDLLPDRRVLPGPTGGRKELLREGQFPARASGLALPW